METAAPKTFPAIIQETLTVVRKYYVTPGMLRIVLGGDGVSNFEGVQTGINNKIYIPPVGADTIYFPSFEHGAWVYPAGKAKPDIRTYTLRALDLEKGEMHLEFVVHGDSGPASAWAIRAVPGDILGVAMKAKTAPLYPEADWYLLVGDQTALPVISVILETLPAHAKGIALIEVPGRAEEQEIRTQANDMIISWLHNPHPGTGTLLADMVQQVLLPDKTQQSRFIYAAAETASIKAIRHYLRKEQDVDSQELDAYAYWKYGVSEDRSSVERHQESRD
ncbi:siderophore-interacting protein [Chitinophaga pendula]|uniref:siderophore-interacting protein n=1 Tax=Chitinophaga TaxID=79328 RepID=UPI000BAF19E8|nr:MULTISPECIES: siderophore-interacting protein [Chitinophaga]ASZ12208.1 NADPH-dependent ferric siderophore reductase [Chitinophaga sp. MD30]UCJ04762.1 siderophore-interacting protein [Chitinophaga pendula]